MSLPRVTTVAVRTPAIAVAPRGGRHPLRPAAAAAARMQPTCCCCAMGVLRRACCIRLSSLKSGWITSHGHVTPHPACAASSYFLQRHLTLAEGAHGMTPPFTSRHDLWPLCMLQRGLLSRVAHRLPVAVAAMHPARQLAVPGVRPRCHHRRRDARGTRCLVSRSSWCPNIEVLQHPAKARKPLCGQLAIRFILDGLDLGVQNID